MMIQPQHVHRVFPPPVLRRGLGQTLPDGTLIKNITSGGAINGTLCSCCPGYQNVTAANAGDINACCAGNGEAMDSCGNLWGVDACGDYIAAHQVELGGGKVGTTGCTLPAFPGLTWNMDANWGAPGPGELTIAQMQAPLAQYQPGAAPSTTPASTGPAGAAGPPLATTPAGTMPSCFTPSATDPTTCVQAGTCTGCAVAPSPSLVSPLISPGGPVTGPATVSAGPAATATPDAFTAWLTANWPIVAVGAAALLLLPMLFSRR